MPLLLTEKRVRGSKSKRVTDVGNLGTSEGIVASLEQAGVYGHVTDNIKEIPINEDVMKAGHVVPANSVEVIATGHVVGVNSGDPEAVGIKEEEVINRAEPA